MLALKQDDCETSYPTSSSLVGEYRIGDCSVEIFNQADAVGSEWQALENRSSDPYCSRAWVESWYKAHESSDDYTPIIILMRDAAGNPEFVLPLVRRKLGPFHVLMRPGHRHSAYYRGLFTPAFEERLNASNCKKFWSRVFSCVPKVDVIALDGICDEGKGEKSPLSFLPSVQSSNSAFRMDLTGNWDEQYRSLTTSKQRSNDARCKKRLAELGDLEFTVARSHEEKRQFLHELLALKSAQFEAMKVANPYEQPKISSAYEFISNAYDEGRSRDCMVSVLRLNGEVLAASLGIKHGDEYHGLVMGMTTGEHKKFAPGRLLLLELNRHLSNTDIRFHDFGTGDTSYKLNWCNQEKVRYNAIFSVSAKGWFFAHAVRFVAKGKGWVKEFRSSKFFELGRRTHFWVSKHQAIG